jgi:tetratricopeptide (TPR) repeat protein
VCAYTRAREEKPARATAFQRDYKWFKDGSGLAGQSAWPSVITGLSVAAVFIAGARSAGSGEAGMKITTLTAIALAAAVSAAPAAAAQQQAPAKAEAPKVKISEKAAPAIMALQTAVNANDVANIPAKLAAAKAVAKSKDEQFVVAQLQMKAALAAKDNTATAAAIDAMAASGYLEPGKVSDLYSSLGVTFYNAKQYDQAATAFEHASSINPNNPAPLKLLAETRNAQGRTADAVATLNRVFQLTAASGQKPDEDFYKRAVSIAYNAQSPMAVDLSRQWAAAYPSAQSWRNSISIYRNLNHPDVEGTLALLRLMQATNSLTSGSDYSLFASASAEQGNYNEAQAVVDAGIAAKLIDPSSPQYRDIITGLRTKQKATAADLAIATKTAANGTALLRIGDRYYAMGQYDKATELYRMAMGKPGVDPAVANLHLGMALARSGDKAGATAALNAVTGPRSEIAKYWLIYVQQKG